MRLLAKALSVLLIGASAVIAKADILNFTLTGEGNSYTFSLLSNPVPAVSAPGTFFILNNVAVSVNHQPDIIADLTFFSSTNSGGVDIFPSSKVDPILSLDGPQLYTGTEMSPIFAPGTFSLGNPATEKPYSLVISQMEPLPVPEPSTLLLLGTGLVTAFGVFRQKLLTRI
jgi:hypothetical protein